MDNIVKENMFIDFLIRAKRNTYAAQGDESSVEPVLIGSKQLEYKEGLLFYRDIYFGFVAFVGQEVVYNNMSPIWSMVYAAKTYKEYESIVKINEIYRFLRITLREIPRKTPYRGPLEGNSGDFRYINKVKGDIPGFDGVEKIYFKGKLVYKLDYSGGRVE